MEEQLILVEDVEQAVPPAEHTREQSTWSCMKCEADLEPGKVGVFYLGSTFPVDLLRCPRCGVVYIPEAMALGKMADVEKLLKDKLEPHPCGCGTVLKTLAKVGSRMTSLRRLQSGGLFGMSDLDEVLFPIREVLDFSASLTSRDVS